LDDVPTFKSNWPEYEDLPKISSEERRMLSFRAFRTRLALVNTKNHYLITCMFPDYFKKACMIKYNR
jgi:hypothetical protein